MQAQKNRNIVQDNIPAYPGKFLRELVGCKQNKRRKPSEMHPTAARIRAWNKANKKRSENNRKITHGIVYKLTSPSGKAYVGISKYSIERRILWHKSSGSCCHAIKAALRKYGFDSFKKEILHSNVPLDQLPSLEVEEINRHGTLQPNGYNLTKGGEYNPMEESSARKKVSDAKTKYWQDAGASARQRAAESMQMGDARARATATKLARGLERARNRASKMPPKKAEKYIKDFLKARERRQAEYAARVRA